MLRNAGVGISRRAWRGWPGVETLPIVAPEILVPRQYRAVVVAAHPDDESIGLRGTIARLAMLKRSLLLVAATDGCGAWPGADRGQVGPSGIASMLTAWRVVQRLGAGRAMVLRTGIGAGAVSRIERDLEWRLRSVLLPSDVVFATWRGDGHPDHDAIGRLAARACGALGVHLIEVPRWAWLWTFPGDRRIPWQRARRVFVDTSAKARARRLPSRGPDRRHGAPGRSTIAAESSPFARPYEIVFV
jgi:LmbE family N-acetylglucosaminyl deacetylase